MTGFLNLLQHEIDLGLDHDYLQLQKNAPHKLDSYVRPENNYYNIVVSSLTIINGKQTL